MNLIDLALAVLALAFVLAVVRAIRGPSVADRAMAADVGLFSILSTIAVLGVRTHFTGFLDIILVATILAFLAAVALAALVGRFDT